MTNFVRERASCRAVGRRRGPRATEAAMTMQCVLSSLLLASVATGQHVVKLTPANWHANIFAQDSRWIVYFAVTGCKHCEQLRPMMNQLAPQAAQEGLRVGRVNASLHNGIARTFDCKRFPTILYIDGPSFFEFEGKRRSIPAMLEWSRRPPPGARRTPTELQPNVAEWWLLLEALWPPFKMAASWAVGIALGIKLLTTGCLRMLERQNRKEKARRKEQRAACATDKNSGDDSDGNTKQD